MQKLISTLFVAMITALSTVAYTNPIAYRAVALWVALLSTAAVLVFFIWCLGAESRTDFSVPGATNSMLRAVYLMGGWLALLAFMTFLYFLPSTMS